MPAIVGHTDFNPEKEIPSLSGKIVFITGGSRGIGASTVRHLAAHNATHIYFSGRNAKAGNDLITDIHTTSPKVGLTFVEMDLTSLPSVKHSLQDNFKHDRLDLLICNAGIMAEQPKLSADGYEIQFAVNHLGNAMVTSYLLPVLLDTAKHPGSDVRVINITSLGYALHPSCGISFQELDAHSTMSRFFMGPWLRYGQSKLANILYASELARRHPEITAMSVHPGVVETDLVHTQTFLNRCFISFANWVQGIKMMQPEQGAWSTIWCAAAAKKEELRNGGFYIPVGEERTKDLGKVPRSERLAGELWEWTESVLSKI